MTLYNGMFLALLAPCILAAPSHSGGMAINIDWSNHIITSKTSTTLQVVVNPPLLKNSSVHDGAFKALSLVSSDYVRFVPWFPYPKLSVPELEAPVMQDGTCTTSWNFTYMDDIMSSFYAATPGVKHIINFSTSPDWMWVTDTPYSYPEDINTIDFSYNNGTQFRDPSMKELSDYFARIVSWYVNGGFEDECGVYHHSGHNYDIEFWEVLNEADSEHTVSPEFYNQIYDSVVPAIQKVSPKTQFVGLALAARTDAYFESFLNSSNHKADIPLDWMSYHFYAGPNQASEPEEAASSYAMADSFFTQVEQIESIRKRLSPHTKTTLDEIGTFDPLGTTTIVPGYTPPPEYWVWSGGVFAYVFSNVAKMGIDVVGESQLMGYPGQYPSVSMVNYTTGAPNARLRVLELLQKSFRPGDVLVETTSGNETSLHAQAFQGKRGERKVLLINKGAEAIQLQMAAFSGGSAAIVDVLSCEGEPRMVPIKGSSFVLPPYATAVVQSGRNHGGGWGDWGGGNRWPWGRPWGHEW